jgi:HSP20 family protein
MRNLIKFNENFLEKFFNDEDLTIFKAGFLNDGLKSTNVSKNDKDWLIEMQVPGFRKEDIKIQIENDYLIVSGEIKNESKNYTFREFKNEKFSRKFILPKNISDDDIKAECKDGILTIQIKEKIEENKKKYIEIK